MAFCNIFRCLWRLSSCEKSNSVSLYEHFIHVCGVHGIDEEALRRDLEYQILADYAIYGCDRHLNNIGIIRDANTLKFLRMAPIYDSGNALFVNDIRPLRDRDLENIAVNSFNNRENQLLKHVRERDLLDITKLPSPSDLKRLYEMDTKMFPHVIDMIAEVYEKRIDKLRAFQLGIDPGKRYFQALKTENDIEETDDVRVHPVAKHTQRHK